MRFSGPPTTALAKGKADGVQSVCYRKASMPELPMQHLELSKNNLKTLEQKAAPRLNMIETYSELNNDKSRALSTI